MEENISCTNDLPTLMVVDTHMLKRKQIENEGKEKEMNVPWKDITASRTLMWDRTC